MDDLRGHNRLEAAGILLLSTLLLGLLLGVPLIRQAPIIEAPAEAPAAAP
jgi:hypothetical protein